MTNKLFLVKRHDLRTFFYTSLHYYIFKPFYSLKGHIYGKDITVGLMLDSDLYNCSNSLVRNYE